jgi:MFS family permease
VRIQLGLPKSLKPIFWAMVFLEATFGGYLGIWPLWIEHLGAPITVVGLVLGSGGFLRLLVLIPSANIAERLGYRRAMVICRSLTAIGLAFAALATDWWQLGFTVLCAAAGELVFPLVLTLTSAHTGEDRLRAFTLIFTVGPSLALIVSPLISGLLVDLWGMRAAFLFAAACTTTSIFFLRQVEEPPKTKTATPAPSASYKQSWADHGVRTVVVLLGGTIFSLSLGSSLIPTFLEDYKGIAPSTITALTAMSAVGSTLLGLAVSNSRWLQRYPFIIVTVAIVMTGLGFMLFRTSAAIPVLIVAFFLRGGLFTAWVTYNAAMSDVASAFVRARSFAMAEMTSGIAYALGPIVAAPLYDRRPTFPFEIAIVLALILVPIVLLAQLRLHRLRVQREALDPAI